MEQLVKILKIVNKDKKYLSKNGKEYSTCNYYVVLNISGKDVLVPIRPAFRRGYDLLDMVAEIRVNAVVKPSTYEEDE